MSRWGRSSSPDMLDRGERDARDASAGLANCLSGEVRNTGLGRDCGPMRCAETPCGECTLIEQENAKLDRDKPVLSINKEKSYIHTR